MPAFAYAFLFLCQPFHKELVFGILVTWANINFILCTVCQCPYVFLWLKYYFSSFFPVNPFNAVNSLLSHSTYYFLHPRISKSSLSSFSSRQTPSQIFLRYPFLISSSHVTIPVQLLISYII